MIKKLFKRYTKSVSGRRLICRFIAAYIRLVYYTSRVTFDMQEEAMPYVKGHSPAVFAFWHGRLLMMPMIRPPGRKMNVLISNHRDGEIISTAMHHFGFGTIRGSSSRGGAGAAIKSVKALQAGENVSITPDGPRGPAMHVQPGVITIAQMAGLPVVHVTFSASRRKRMKSWDGFMVALPFGRLYFKAGILHAPTLEQLEAQMVAFTNAADKIYGA